MTAPTAALCSHRWQKPPPKPNGRHRCAEPADHADPCPCPVGTCTVHCQQPPVHRCRCGATTRKDEP